MQGLPGKTVDHGGHRFTLIGKVFELLCHGLCSYRVFSSL
jgi:hypothetical protein